LKTRGRTRTKISVICKFTEGVDSKTAILEPKTRGDGRKAPKRK